MQQTIREPSQMRYLIYPYKTYSEAAHNLRDGFKDAGFKSLIIKENGNYLPRRDETDIVINWGNSTPPRWSMHYNNNVFLNDTYAVELAINKLNCLSVLYNNGVPAPEFSTDIADALVWLSEKSDIVCRKTVTGHSGEGIELVKYRDDLQILDIPECPLYTKYIKKRDEYRVHVFKGDVIDIQLKKKAKAVDVNYQVRTHAGGWIFAREDINPPEQVIEAAINAVNALGLDFGAVDVAWNTKKGAFVLEVNTAPGLEGQTIQSYVTAITEDNHV